MESNEATYVKGLAVGNRYHESDNIYFKEMDGYLIVMVEQSGRVVIEVRSGLESGTMPMAVGEGGVSEISEKDNVNDCFIAKESIQLSFLADTLSALEVEDLTKQIVELLKEHHVHGLSNCRFCGKEMTQYDSVIIKVNGRLEKVHKECYHSFVEEIEEAKKINHKAII